MIFGFTDDFVNRALTRVFFQKAGILQLELANERVAPLQKAVSEFIPQPCSAPESYKRATRGVCASSPLLPPAVRSPDSVPHLASTRDLLASQLKMGRALEKKQNQSPSGISVFPINFLCTSLPPPLFKKYFTAPPLLS